MQKKLRASESALDLWKDVWERTDRTVSFPPELDDALAKFDLCGYELRNECARIMSVKETTRSDYEKEMVKFFLRTKFTQESILEQRLMTHPTGQIHVGKVRFGMIANERLEISGRSLEEVING